MSAAQVGDAITGQQAAGLPDGTVLAPLPGAGHEVRMLIRGEWFAPTAITTGLFHSEEPGHLVMDPWMFQQGERWVIAYLPGQPPRPAWFVKAQALREYAADLDRDLAKVDRITAADASAVQVVRDALLARAYRIESAR